MTESNRESVPASSSSFSSLSPSRATVILFVWSLVLTGLLVWVAYGQSQLRQELAAQGESLHQQLSSVEARADQLEGNLGDVRAEISATADKVGITQKQLEAARAQARKLREEQQKADAQLAEQLQQQQTSLSTVSSDLESVKGTLQSAVGDLGVQSGLIATTREDLAELKRRGERDYFEFDLAKSKQFSRVGEMSIKVTKVDPKRQKFTMVVLLNDKAVEKKDKTIFEPVQFYPGEKGALVELVVFEVSKNRVAGYVAAPKQLAWARPQQ
ncbi:MAG TPA: hypothetical protein VNN18_06900 [Candidatus Xenobia bacterium]|nr:hypothetical protein [Candidatus Xenobia bacterium]